MPQLNVVVDGSNIATEGRSLPSLVQLDEAVRAFIGEFPDAQITVVVDATFGHRIEDSEVASFKDAEANGELVSPPAGAIGRGDAFLLRIAEKIDAMVLSNDSFQEFHGEHEWLFEPDRLIGGKPVPGVGWIFTPRTPVRGPKSRVAVKEAKRAKSPEKIEGKGEGRNGDGGRGRGGRGRGRKAEVEAVEVAAEGSSARGKGRGKGRSDDEKPKRKKVVESAIEAATEEAVEPEGKGRKRRRRGGGPPAEPVNAPLEFLEFVAAHPLGSNVAGEVESFSSHGCFVNVGPVRCYLPLSGMGDPPPRSAREVLKRGEEVVFTIQAFDPPRRGVELALPPFAHPAGAPTAETVEAEITGDGVVDVPRRAKRASTRKAPADVDAQPASAGKPAKRGVGRKAAAQSSADVTPELVAAAAKPAAKRSAGRKAAAERPSETQPAKAATKPSKRGATRTAEAPPRAAAAKTAPDGAPEARAAKKTASGSGTRAAATKKAASAKKAASSAKQPAAAKSAAKPAAEARTAAKAAVSTMKKAPTAKKATAKKATTKQASTAKTAAAKKGPAAKKTAANKTAAKKTAAKKTAAKKTAVKKTAVKKTAAKKTAAKKTAAKKTR